ncbi:MAG TPA: hypothetical protein VE954_09210 [Oligoflexus sp.]|uniref:hypothetical protein n=1 Tax=Oligoflexus sp. TaxID=1971216 RepID=UPI002D632B1C|nr:hypothetical protein [Oligoflexus sp.]HYX33279.1 hypothetical protein [Oligoflexus sp.]
MNISRLLVVMLALVVSHCKKSSDSKTDTEESAAEAEGEKPAVDTPAVIDYPKLYCENVEKIKLRSDVTEELRFFCADGKPTKEFLDFRGDALSQTPGGYQLKLLQAQHDPDGDRSEFFIAWSFHVPIRPFEVKARPIYDYVAQNYSSDVIDLKANAARRLEDPLDSGLHLWSADMNYDLVIKGTQGLRLTSQRQTQYNLYQVQSGNEEMGFGVEHLPANDNPNYSRSVMLNVSFNDGSGYNDGKGGTVVITLLHFVLSNQGFPATATKSIQEIAQNAADGMYNGLKE